MAHSAIIRDNTCSQLLTTASNGSKASNIVWRWHELCYVRSDLLAFFSRLILRLLLFRFVLFPQFLSLRMVEPQPIKSQSCEMKVSKTTISLTGHNQVESRSYRIFISRICELMTPVINLRRNGVSGAKKLKTRGAHIAVWLFLSGFHFSGLWQTIFHRSLKHFHWHHPGCFMTDHISVSQSQKLPSTRSRFICVWPSLWLLCSCILCPCVCIVYCCTRDHCVIFVTCNRLC